MASTPPGPFERCAPESAEIAVRGVARTVGRTWAAWPSGARPLINEALTNQAWAFQRRRPECLGFAATLCQMSFHVQHLSTSVRKQAPPGASVDHRLLGSRPGQRPYGQLVVPLGRVGLLADQGPDDAAQEPEWD